MAGPEPEPTDVPAEGPALERRAFVRQMTHDAVGMAGRVVGLSRALGRGAVAAGASIRENLEAAAASSESSPRPAAAEPEMPPAAAEPEMPPAAAEPATRPAAPSPPAIAPPSDGLAPPARRESPSLGLSEAQAAILADATTAVLAVNGSNGPPIVVPVPIHWDGETIRFASLGWSRRSAAIRSDPRVSLVVQEPDSDRFLFVEGTASVLVGPAAREAIAPLLGETDDPEATAQRWEALLAADPDRVVVVVRPSRVLPGRRA